MATRELCLGFSSSRVVRVKIEMDADLTDGDGLPDSFVSVSATPDPGTEALWSRFEISLPVTDDKAAALELFRQKCREIESDYF